MSSPTDQPQPAERLFGLIGRKLSHSFSRTYFTRKFTEEGIPAAYELFELDAISAFPDLIARHPKLRGLNVTIPYKSAVIPYLDALADEAAAVGAVNTIKISSAGRLTGYNTDTFGFRVSVEKLLAGSRPKAALVLGTGGAAKAVVYVLREILGLQEIRLVSRRPVQPDQFSYEALSGLNLQAYPLIVNTTPVGMYPDTEAAPDIPYAQLGPAHYVIDLIYNPEETRFLKLAARQGAHTANGMEMLIQQAEKAWEIWNRPE
jgi:shikimate dehydrogenase